jgi:hypothetical protein
MYCFYWPKFFSDRHFINSEGVNGEQQYNKTIIKSSRNLHNRYYGYPEIIEAYFDGELLPNNATERYLT